MANTVSIENLNERGKELVEHVRSTVDRALESGRAYVETTRSTLEAEALDLLGKVRSRSQKLIHAGLGARLEQVQKLQSSLTEHADALLQAYGSKVAERVPAAQAAVGFANTLVRQADERLKSLLEGARSAIWSVPIANYDSLTAAEALKAIKKLSPADVALVKAYESAHKARKTVLKEIEALLA